MGAGVSRIPWVLALAVAIAVHLSPVTPASASEPPGGPLWDPGPVPASFSANVRVNTVNLGYPHQVEPTLAVNSQGRIFVGWKEAPTHNGGGYRVGFAYSADGGATFSTNVLMPLYTLERQSDPWLTVTEDDVVYFSRLEVDAAVTEGGLAITNTTDGTAWGTTWFLDDRPNFADKQTHANDAAGNLYMVWNSDSSNYELVFSRSDDGGQSWSPKLRIADLVTGSLGGFVKVHPDGTVLATWWSWWTDDVWFDRSFDGGATWGPDIRVNDVPGSAASPLITDAPVLPAMAVAPNGTIYIVYEDYRNGRPGGIPNGDMDIFFSRSGDHGATWSPGVRLNDDATTARQWMPDLALDPVGGVHVAWMDDRSGAHNVYYVNSTDGGTTWGPNVRVTDAETPLAYNRPGDYLAIESGPDGTMYAVWTDGRGADLDIHFAKLVRTVAYTIDTVPAGLAVSVDGTDYTAPATFSWPVGSDHTITTPGLQPVGPGSRWAFDAWSDGGGAAHDVRAGFANATITATFRMEHLVTVRTKPVPLEVLVDGAPAVAPVERWWPEGSPHELASVGPQVVSYGTRYVFTRWSDASPDPGTFSVTGPATYEAVYRLEFLLEVESEYGTPVGAGWYSEGDLATVSIEDAVTANGTTYRFAGWTGDAQGPSPGVQVAMDGPRALRATWEPVPRATPVDARLWAVVALALAVIILAALIAWRRRRWRDGDSPPRAP